MLNKAIRILLLGSLALTWLPCLSADTVASQLDEYLVQGMKQTKTQGLAIAIVEGGKVAGIKTWGLRNANGDPLTASTVMYGASLTKAVFA